MSKLLDEPILVVRRRPHKGRRPDYEVFDRHGTSVARGVYLQDDELKPLMRRYGLGHQTAAALRVIDAAAATVFVVAFPGWRGRAVVLISDGRGHALGDAIKTKGFLRVTYELRHAGRRVGALEVADRRQRTVVFVDDTGAQAAVARTLTDESPVTVTGDGDGYYVHIQAPLPEPLRSVVVASAITLQAAIGSETSAEGTDVLKLSFIPRFLDPLRRRGAAQAR